MKEWCECMYEHPGEDLETCILCELPINWDERYPKEADTNDRKSE